MEIKFSNKFHKQYSKARSEIRKAFDYRASIFKTDPTTRILNNHFLTGKLKGYKSINVTGDWRAIYFEKNDLVTFVLFGTHSQLYK